MHDDDEARDTPPAVIAAVAAGTGPLPFLAVYSVLFIVHGGFHHVVPPEVTNSNRGELLVGVVCLLVFLVGLVTIVWLLNGRRRWPFVIVQAGLLAVSVDFLTDSTKGGPVVSALVALTSLIGLVMCLHPQVWEHVGRSSPAALSRVFGRRPAPRLTMPAGSAATSDTTPTSARVIGHGHRDD